jgi:hypothetical protein
MTSATRIAGKIGVALILIALTGCASSTKPLYQWGSYQRQVYEYMKGDGTSPSEQLGILMAQAEKARASQEALPPGFRAHLGLVQLKLGQDEEARGLFEAEKTAFPESATYMNFLLKRMTEKKS